MKVLASGIAFLRFLNVLDPDHDMLSPVRIQAWLATANAVADLVSHASTAATTASVAYAALAHTIHQFDKINRSRNLARLGGQDVRPA